MTRMRKKLWYDGELVGRAREMRRRGSGAEVWLWLALRRVRPRFQRQKVLGGYIADFYCASARLAVELDGGVHREGGAIREDAKRTERLERWGVEVLRFENREVWRDVHGVVRRICSVVERRVGAGAGATGAMGVG